MADAAEILEHDVSTNDCRVGILRLPIPVRRRLRDEHGHIRVLVLGAATADAILYQGRTRGFVSGFTGAMDATGFRRLDSGGVLFAKTGRSLWRWRDDGLLALVALEPTSSWIRVEAPNRGRGRRRQ